MKQRKLVVDRIRVEHRLFRFSRKHQSQKTGSYTVTASLACLQWLLCHIISPPHKTGKGTLYQDIISSARSYVIYHIYTLTQQMTYN